MLNPDQIEKLKQIEELKKRESRYAYYGILQEYQLNINEDISYANLNSYQQFLFKRVLHGLKVYNDEQLAKLHWRKKHKIKKVWSKGQKILNEWKQIIANKQINDYLYRTFGTKAQAFLDIPETEILPDYKNTMSLKDLGIRYEDVILKFMSEGLLPKNFLRLDEKDFQKNVTNEQSVQQTEKGVFNKSSSLPS